MKKALILLLFFYGKAFSQTFTVSNNTAYDQTSVLQTAFNSNAVVIVTASTVINGTLNIPEGKILKFEGGKLTGKGTVNGGIIEASYHTQIFDTALTVNPKAVEQYFSVKWFGATGNNTDDYAAIQRSINTCIKIISGRCIYPRAGIKYPGR